MIPEFILVRDIPAAVCELTGGSFRPSKSIVYRWIKTGARGGAKLRRTRVGGLMCVHREWLVQFIVDAEEQPESFPQTRGKQVGARGQSGRTPKWRQDQFAEATRQADAMRI